MTDDKTMCGLWLTGQEKDLLQKAMESTGFRHLSSFVRFAACEKARDILKQRSTYYLLKDKTPQQEG